jgi:hypothetical protein
MITPILAIFFKNIINKNSFSKAYINYNKKPEKVKKKKEPSEDDSNYQKNIFFTAPFSLKCT